MGLKASASCQILRFMAVVTEAQGACRSYFHPSVLLPNLVLHERATSIKQSEQIFKEGTKGPPIASSPQTETHHGRFLSMPGAALSRD